MDVSTFGGYAFDGLRLAVDAIKRAGGLDKDAVRDAIEKTANFPGVSGIYTMTPADHMGLGVQSFVMVEIRNAAFKPVQ